MTPRKVLIVTPFPIEPEIEGNRRRIKVLADQLTGLGAEVHIVILPVKRIHADDLRLMKAHWGKFVYVMPPKYPMSAATRVMNKAERLAFTMFDRFRKRPLGGNEIAGVDIFYFRWWTVRLWLLQVVKKFDIVFAEYIFMSRALAAFGDDVLKVVDTHDVFAERNARISAAGFDYKWWSVTESEEAAAIRRADITLAIEGAEAEQFRRYTDRPVYCVPHVPEPETSADRSSNDRLLIVASGNPLNAQGARWFITKVYPLVRACRPGVSLHVVGDVCSSLTELVTDGASIELWGRVDSVTNHYAAADVVVNPVQIGTGLCIKSIEALAHGRPLVSTSSGARGIAAEAGIVVTDAPDAMADQIVALLQSSAACRASAERGLAYLHTLKTANRKLLGSLLARSRRSNGSEASENAFRE